MSPSTCPGREQLAAYLLGKLPREELEAVADHVDGCPDCRSALESLEGVADSLVPTLRLPPSDETCAADPELGRLVERAGSLVPGGAGVQGDGGAAAAPPPRADGGGPGLPAELDQYRLLGKIGQGGMGAVYRALHVRLEKVVALKVLPAEWAADPEALARFQREMRAVGRLDHANIVRALDAREVDGVPFLVMDYVEGSDLGRLARQRGPLPVPDACELARQAALGLHHAHENGLIHRDVKPSNLVVTPGGLVKVLDLGLARLHAEPQAGEGLTRPGQAMGTPDYMAPEQAVGASAVDARADVYGLGCTLYHLLAGHPPFGRDGYDNVFRKLTAQMQEPVPPIQACRPEIPAALASVLDRMLAKNPAERFGTCAEVAAALQPFTDGCDLPALLSAGPNRVGPAQDRGPEANTPAGSRLGTSADAVAVPPQPTAPRPRAPRWSRRRAALAGAATAAAGLAAVVLLRIGGWGPPHPTADTKPAAPVAAREKRPFLSEKDVLAAIRDHLRQSEPADRRFQRYFTLTHLHNNEHVTAAELRLCRAALAKLVNSLSRKPALVLPRALDREETVYNVDLRRLGWDEQDLWKEVLKAYPYGLTHRTAADPDLRTVSHEVYELADDDLPYLRADWLVATASRPPLHHTLLRPPAPADRDGRRFAQSLEEVTGRFLRVGEDRDKDLRDFPEPVVAVTQLYDRDLGPEEVACELGLDDPARLQALVRDNPRLRELGLGPLTQGGAVKRETWSSKEFAASPFQNAARELGLGTPYVPF